MLGQQSGIFFVKKVELNFVQLFKQKLYKKQY